MQTLKTTILVASFAALAGCASWDSGPICQQTHGWQPWPSNRCDPPEPPRRNLAAELDAANAELAAAQNENQSLGLRLSTVKALLADREKEIANLRADMNRK